MFDSTTLSAVIVGVSVIFAAALVGYFMVQREWIASIAATLESTHAARMRALAQVEFLERLYPHELLSSREADRRSKGEKIEIEIVETGFQRTNG